MHLEGIEGAELVKVCRSGEGTKWEGNAQSSEQRSKKRLSKVYLGGRSIELLEPPEETMSKSKSNFSVGVKDYQGVRIEIYVIDRQDAPEYKAETLISSFGSKGYPLSYASGNMNNHRLGISTISMGWDPSHVLEDKLTAASKYSFAGVEIFWTDLVAFANRHNISPVKAAPLVRDLCHQRQLAIICLGSFDNFEGSQSPLSDRLALAKEWIDTAHGLGTDMIQIPSNDDKSCIGEEDAIVSELRQLAEIGSAASPPVRFAYEALGWGIHVADWEESLRIVELVNRDNFGLCLDTYHILARLWADPSSRNGMRPGGPAALNASMKRLLGFPKERIFYIQLSDAERCWPPLLPGHPAYSIDKDPSHSWCTWGRLFPGEASEGAYLPVTEICRAILMRKGWSGWVSLEIFHRKMKDEGADPEHWARRGRASWDRLCSLLTS